MTNREICLRAVNTPGGARATELPMERRTASHILCDLAKQGKAFAGGTPKERRYFKTRAEAHAFNPIPERPKIQIKLARAEKAMSGRSKEGWGPDDPMHITKATKVTIAKTPAPALRTNTYPVY